MLHSRSPWMVGGYVGIHRATRGAAAAYRNSLTNSRLSPPHSAAPSLPPLIFSVSEIRFWSPARKEGGGRADGRGSASANQTRPMSDVAAAAAAVSLFIISRFYFMRRRTRKLRLSESGVSGQPVIIEQGTNQPEE